MEPKNDADRVKAYKILLVAAITVIVVLGVMLAYDTQKLVRAQNAYNQGWTECANLCNGKINLLNNRLANYGIDVPGIQTAPENSTMTEVRIELQ